MKSNVFEPKMQIIGENLRDYYQLHGFTQEEFAKEIKVSITTLYKMANGYGPSSRILKRIEEGTGMSIETLSSKDLFQEEIERYVLLSENAKKNIAMYCAVEQISKKKLSAMTNVSDTTYERISSGEVVKKSTINRIADAIGIKVETLYSSDEEFADIMWPKKARNLSQEILMVCTKTGTSIEKFAEMAGLSYRTVLKVIKGHIPQKENEHKIKKTIHKLGEKE